MAPYIKLPSLFVLSRTLLYYSIFFQHQDSPSYLLQWDHVTTSYTIIRGRWFISKDISHAMGMRHSYQRYWLTKSMLRYFIHWKYLLCIYIFYKLLLRISHQEHRICKFCKKLSVECTYNYTYFESLFTL